MDIINQTTATDLSTALYLYCFTRAQKVKNDQLISIDDRYPVFTRSYDGITAVLSQVALKEFVGQAAEKQMKDIAWITPRACRHQEVIEQISQQTAVFPARFGTIFSTDTVLADLIQHNHEQICEFLDSIEGQAEWSLKGFLDRNKAIDELATTALASAAQQLSKLSPGSRYFQEKKIQKEAGKQLNQWLNAVLNSLIQELETVSTRYSTRALLSRKATGAETDMVLNGAFLVDHNQLENFHKKIDELNQEHAQAGLTFELSGPWPPYSFCPSLSGNE